MELVFMAHGVHPSPGKIVMGSPEGGVFREGWARVRRPVVAVFWRWRTRWLLHRGMIHARRWWNPFGTTVGIVFLCVLTLALVAWGAGGLLVVIHHDWRHQWFSPDASMCSSKVAASCGAITGVVMPVLLLAASTVLFVVWRLWRVRRFATLPARKEPGRFVQTAGSLMDEVVGRDQLCNAIINNLRDRNVRRPHVITGKVGSGKTAVLVHLAGKLAAQGAVPIPVRLRDAQEGLDFCKLAKKRFEAVVQPAVRSPAESDRVWQWLRQHSDRIVVLADGLEEALNQDDKVSGQRDILIREAIAQADDEELPLVIASRPHDPLRAMQAAISQLEPLSDEASLQYIARSGSWRADPMLLDRIVEAAKMSESPLYLQIAKDLHSRDLLEPLWTEDEGGADVALHDSWALRADLLERWLDALVDGEIHPELPIGRDTRQAVVEYISALACIGLADDHGDVGLWELDPSVCRDRSTRPGSDSEPLCADDGWNERVAMTLDRHVHGLRWVHGAQKSGRGTEGGGAQQGWSIAVEGPRIDVRLAATWGRRMGLVDEDGEAVHFQHSIMQAYLGSRLLPRIREREDEDQLTRVLRKGGRELLIALTLHSRSLKGRCEGGGCGDPEPEACTDFVICRLLRKRALELLKEAERGKDMRGLWQAGRGAALDDRGSPRQRALEMFGAAVEIDSVAAAPEQDCILEMIKKNWSCLGRGEDPVRLREAKLTLVKQCGAAARRVAADRKCNPAYGQLFEIGCREFDYQVRAGIAHEIGTGGEQAYMAVHDRLLKPELNVCDFEGGRRRACVPPLAKAEDGNQGERVHRARRRERMRDRMREEWKEAEQEARWEKWRWNHDTMRAWVLPMLVDSTKMTRHLDSPRDDLENWVDIATGESGFSPGAAVPGTDIGLGVTLAQGFKFAANRRPGPQSDRQAREWLVKHAEEMLKRSTFWYTRLTLLQALTLWALPDDVNEDRPIRGHGADPRGQVDEWLTLRGGRRTEHPLVEAAGKLAVRALQTRRPERFLWIDEAATADRVGTEVGLPGDRRAHNLWIPPSTGWSTMDPLTQQLLADVLLLVVLGERGYRPRDLFRILDFCSHERTQVPSCVIKNRSRLDPVRGVERTLQPGSNCTDECRLRLCPYPAKVENLRLEFSEVFCLQQRDLLRRWRPRTWLGLRFRREAPWQHKVPVAGMRRFWDQMGQRARDVNPDEADRTRT
ncbi:NACHT domain-containing protein [Streptomyces gilvosporeus]|nr:NACHT domain-containing protein [Streptomyces gilvosporeus]